MSGAVLQPQGATQRVRQAADGQLVSFIERPCDSHAAAALAEHDAALSSSVAQVLLQRGIDTPAVLQRFLRPRLQHLQAPHSMADRDAATARIVDALKRQERMVVFGDYDVDGTTSAALLTRVLRRLGGDVQPLIAKRFDGGYGLSARALERCLEGRPSLLLTCDCGSTDHAQVEAARRRGVDTIVVDHHRVPDEPLPAVAFLNPHRPDCGFPFKGMASVGLVFTLAAALRTAMAARFDLREELDLVALGTVADLAPLADDNRCLVRAGLTRLGAVQGRPGVVALRQRLSLAAGSAMSARDISFRVAPRLNAAGRMGDAELVLGLLLSRNAREAQQLASRLEQINQQRRAVEGRMTAEAFTQVETLYGHQPEDGLVVAARGWHRGVVGITAARLQERYRLPVLVAAIDDDGVAHGSGRAPDGFALYDAVAKARPLLRSFGGHQAAIGFSVQEKHIDALRADFAAACSAQHAASTAARSCPYIDVTLSPGRFPLPDAAELALLEPLGQGNAAPTFLLPDARCEGTQVIAEEHLRLDLRYQGVRLRAFAARAAQMRAQVLPCLHA
ncbi:MAG: single-stranded-DNA-specific exonuclease RecJ, partial [Polyangiales bacterium]